jgi:hypothetical protein
MAAAARFRRARRRNNSPLLALISSIGMALVLGNDGASGLNTISHVDENLQSRFAG